MGFTLLAVALGGSACADGIPFVSDAMKPRTAADVVTEQLGDDVELHSISSAGGGHAWYERVAEGRATVTFERDGEICLGLGRIEDGEESSEFACAAPFADLEEPRQVELGLEDARLWQVPDGVDTVTVVRNQREQQVLARSFAGGSWVIDDFGADITDVRVGGDG